MEPINDSNYELWLLRYADDGLTADERKRVEQWLDAHPEAAEELALYREAPRLERDESVHYTAATQPNTRPLWGKSWRWTAAAAVTLLLLTPLALRLLGGSGAEPVQVAQATPPAETRRAVSAISTTQHDAIIADAAHRVSTDSQLSPSVGTRRAAAAADSTVFPVADELLVNETLADVPTDTLLMADAVPAVGPKPDVSAADSAVILIDNETIAEATRHVPTDVPADGSMDQVTTVEPIIIEEDTLDYLEQRLLALADGTREGLQGSYLGRRLARRLPENQELLAQMDEARERTPRGIRMVTDLVVKLIEVNSKENNQQNSITL